MAFGACCKTCRWLRYVGRCAQERLLGLFGGEAALERPALAALVERLQQLQQDRVVKWIAALAPPLIDLLQSVGDGAALSYERLAPLLDLAGGAQLLRYCLEAGVIDTREAACGRIDAVVETFTTAAPWAGPLLREYWGFHRKPLLPQTKDRVDADPTLEHELEIVRTCADLLRHLATLPVIADLTQNVLEAYFADRPPRYRKLLANFIKWLREKGKVRRPLHVELGVEGCRAATQRVYLTTLYRARHDDTLAEAARAGLLLLMVGMREPSAFLGLDCAAVREEAGGTAQVRFARGRPFEFEGAEAALLLRYRGHRRGPLFPSPRRPNRAGCLRIFRNALRRGGIATSCRELRMAGIREYVRRHGAAELAKALGCSATAAKSWADRFGEPVTDLTARLAELDGTRVARQGWTAAR